MAASHKKKWLMLYPKRYPQDHVLSRDQRHMFINYTKWCECRFIAAGITSYLAPDADVKDAALATRMLQTDEEFRNE